MKQWYSEFAAMKICRFFSAVLVFILFAFVSSCSNKEAAGRIEAGSSIQDALDRSEADPYYQKRKAMVDLVANYSPNHRVTDKKVLDAMMYVKRHEFIPKSLVNRAYGDHPLPIGENQTISQPFIVGYMTQMLDLSPEDKVLEVGTGSGYQAAILSRLVRWVYSIEIVESLGKHARRTIKLLGYENVDVRLGDGYQGWPEQAPFDAIIVTCAPENIPEPLIEQLKTGGRMVIPVGSSGGAQELILLIKTEDGIKQQKRMHVRFVPMTGEAQKK
ncbi:protein-L-isoaspartate(D-aspartate) O-methyltransferase [Elusimicrobiota bacterium]